MVMVASWGAGLSKKKRRELEAEQKRLNAEHRRRAVKSGDVATLSNPSTLLRKKRAKSTRTINGYAPDHPDRTQARASRKASVLRRGTVPNWAVRLATKFVRWTHDAHIVFKDPDRDMKNDSWQVALVIPMSAWGREHWEETVRKIRGFEWVIAHHKDGLKLTVWRKGSKPWRK